MRVTPPEVKASPAGLASLLTRYGVHVARRLHFDLGSLRFLERVHHEIVTHRLDVPRRQFERLFGMFFGQVLVVLAGGRWIEFKHAGVRPVYAVKLGAATYVVVSVVSSVYAESVTKRPRRRLSRALDNYVGESLGPR